MVDVVSTGLDAVLVRREEIEIVVSLRPERWKGHAAPLGVRNVEHDVIHARTSATRKIRRALETRFT